MKEKHRWIIFCALAMLILFVQGANAFDGNVASLPAKYLAQGFGSLEIGGFVLLFVVGFFCFTQGVPLSGTLPIMTLAGYALWQTVGGIFETIWILLFIACVVVVPLGLWRSVNK